MKPRAPRTASHALRTFVARTWRARIVVGAVSSRLTAIDIGYRARRSRENEARRPAKTGRGRFAERSFIGRTSAAKRLVRLGRFTARA